MKFVDKDQSFFVGQELNFTTGAEAARLVKTTNDLAFADEVRGIVQVPRDRWGVAQKYECNTWMLAGLRQEMIETNTTESNFDHYVNLRGKYFNSAIEIGCGPFTNLRVIARHCKIARCTLLDPLSNEYLRHKNCAYSRKLLNTDETLLSKSLEKYPAGRAIRRLLKAIAPRTVRRGIRLERLINLPIEDITDIGQYDLVVMINVIEHCFDIDRVFESVKKLCKPGTFFVFHDRLYNAQKVKLRAARQFDAGHPLRVDESVIANFLETYFHRMSERQTIIEDGYGGIDFTERGIYFVGLRK